MSYENFAEHSELYDNVCAVDGCDHYIHINDHVCEECELFRCSVCGDTIDTVYSQGREHMCGKCRETVVAQCTCASQHGEPIVYTEDQLQEECRFMASHPDSFSVWECSNCKRPMYVNHDRDGNIQTLHERGKELDRMATVCGGF